MTVFQTSPLDDNPDPTYAGITPTFGRANSDGIEFDSIETIEIPAISLDQGSEWYLIREGERFTSSTIAAGEFIEPIVKLGPTYLGSVPVNPIYFVTDENGVPDEFHLGFTTSLTNGPDQDVFGWVRLGIAPSRFGEDPILTVVGSATSYNSAGIIIGTLTAIPEPTASALIVISAMTASTFRRRRQ